MEHALAEMPLAIFTTLAPISAGAFLALALAFFTSKLPEEVLKKVDRFSWIPVILLVVAFVAAFFHLSQPFNAVNVLDGIGRSPMSNEIIAGVVFFVVILAYSIIGTVSKMSDGLRKAFAAIAAVVGLVFSIFVGNAYMIETIMSWNTALVPVGVVGFFIFGGMLFGLFILGIAGALEELKKTAFKTGALALLILGAAISIVCVLAQVGMVNGMTTYAVEGAALVSDVMVLIVLFVLCSLIALGLGCFSVLKSTSATMPAVGFVVVIIAILLARLVFYALEMSVGF